MAMDLFWAFLVGGALCAVGQVLIDYTKLTPARILTAYVVAGVALSAVGIYPKLVELAGGGASVPLTGFAQGFVPETVREHYAALSHHAGECIACVQCMANCPFGVAIISAMQKAAPLFGE